MAALEIPDNMGFNSKIFRLGFAQQLNPSGPAGYIQTLNRTAPFWVAQYTTPPLTGQAYRDTRRFLDRLEGSMNTFLAYDPRTPMPQAYPTATVFDNPWGATPRITAQDYTASTISLDQLTPGASILTGDYISVKVGLIWYLFRASADATANGAGIVAGLEVKPRPNISSFATTVIRYRRACIEMKIIGDVTEDDSVEDCGTKFTFKAAQFTNMSTG